MEQRETLMPTTGPRNPSMRSASLKVNLTPQIYDRLKQLAERQGQTAAVLASVAVGQYVSMHMASLDTQREMQAKALEILERLPQQLLELDTK
jgi:predicted transcriptional regulator